MPSITFVLPDGTEKLVHDWDSMQRQIPRYDTDWSATGPLIEKYGITLFEYHGDFTAFWHSPKKVCPTCANETSEDIEYPKAFSDTQRPRPMPALTAVCHLILALKEAGKL